MDIKSKIKLPRISLFNPFENEDKLGLLCWNEYYGGINIDHDLLNGKQLIFTKTQKSKGEAKRKAIQFCSELNLEYVVV